ncbi:ester cyclase [Undibacterium sp. TJN19]|uniref:ester cyclase n=1 Tax=Undibacterium sp. TJN19 TaxID=3413055 RepID=UPI003BF04310
MKHAVFSKIVSAATLATASSVLFSPSTLWATTLEETSMHAEIHTAPTAHHRENMVRSYYQAAEMHPYQEEAVSVFFDEHYQSYPPRKNGPDISGKQSVLSLLKNLSEGFPDGKRSFAMIEPVGEDKVLVYFTFTGTHTGSFFSYPPTGNKVSFVGVDIFTVKDNKFISNHHVEDLSTLLEQLKSN